MPILGIMASQISGKLWAPDGAYDSLATVTLSASTASITFAGIPNTYKHLQIRGIGRTNNSGGDPTQDYLRLRFNNDSGSNYSYHALFGDGSSATAGNATSQTTAYIQRVSGNSSTSGVFGAFVLDILDYQNTNKNKTTRILGGVDNNGSGRIYLTSNLWMNTSAVTQLDISVGDGSLISQYSQFSLYGVR
jgi:hypothetical protein